MAKSVVLAYSGGLDTSVILKKFIEKGYEVTALLVDVGQNADLEEARNKANTLGAEGILVDGREEFVREFILPALKANALYEKQYPLFTSLSRYLIARHLVKVAEEKKADLIAHGCTGKGNDQVRFEVSIAALNPNLKVVAPVRNWELNRAEALEYAEKMKIPLEIDKNSPYSIDENLWGRSIECGVLEDPMVEPPEDAFKLTVSPEKAPSEAEYVEIDFEKGEPVALNGEKMETYSLIKKLDKIAGLHGVGRIDMIENRVVGLKSREVYEAPAATVLIEAHSALESLVLERELAHYKQLVEQKFSELIYYGLWYSPLREALQAFIDKSQEFVTGKVRLKLYKGKATVVGRFSPYSLYEKDLATYEGKDLFSHQSSQGFIEIFGLPLKVWAEKQKRRRKD